MDLYCYDFCGVYLGRLDDGGIFFDRDGRKRAQVVERSGVYDLEGRYLGRIDAQGSFFTADGTCRGYVRNWNIDPLTGRHPDGSLSGRRGAVSGTRQWLVPATR